MKYIILVFADKCFEKEVEDIHEAYKLFSENHLIDKIEVNNMNRTPLFELKRCGVNNFKFPTA